MRKQHVVLLLISGLGIGGLVIASFLIGLPNPSPLVSSSTSVKPSVWAAGTPADRVIRAAEARVARDAQNTEGYVALATAYMDKARETGSPEYYLRAEAAVQRALALQPDSYEGLRTLAWIQTGKHEFHQALTTAERLRVQRPDDPWVYALLGDAYVELGDYERAVEAFEQMMGRKPGLPAYSRVAHLRELYGDVQGATEVMAMAVRAGSTRDPEPLAWSLVQYGNLYFKQGNLGVAEAAYQKALAVFPNYYQALASLGRVRGAQQRYDEAIALYQQAIAIVPAPDTVAALGDVLAITGKPDETEKQYALVEYIEHVNAINQVTYNRQLALFYADHDRKLDEAVKLAETELERRKDIYTYDTLAWVYYKTKRFTDARKMMEHALRLETKDASLFFHAGMIAYRLGEMDKAKDYLHRALETNPYFSPAGVELARATLAEMGQRTVAQGGTHVP